MPQTQAYTPSSRRTERGRRWCQKNPEGRKLDRQTEADPGFTVPMRHPPDSQTLRNTPLTFQEGEGESGPQSLLKPNSSSSGIEVISAKQEALSLTSLRFHIPLDQGRGHFPLAVHPHLQGMV